MTIIKPISQKNPYTEYWYVLCVTPQKEMEIAHTLKSIGIEAFCPVSNQVSSWRDQKKIVPVALFKSYVFVKISKRNRVLVFNVPGITRYLFVEGRPAQIRDSEIKTLKSWLEEETVYEIVISNCTSGDIIPLGNTIHQRRKIAMEKIQKKNPKIILKCLDLCVEANVKETLTKRKYYAHQSLN